MLLLLLALVGVVGCRTKDGDAAARVEVLIGATLPLTGAESKVGGFFKQGYDLAFEELARAGGLNVGGQKLPARLLLLDDTTTQATAVSLPDKLINSDKVDFLLGTYSTYVFGLAAPVELLGETLMRWIDGQQQAGKLPKPARIALVWENTAHGKDFQRGVSEFAKKTSG